MRKQINDSFHNNEPTCWQVWDFIWFRNISDIMNWVCLFYCTRQRHKRSKNKALCVSFRYHGLQTYSITLPRWISNSIKKRPTIYDTVAIHAMLFTWGTARHSVENMECLVCLNDSELHILNCGHWKQRAACLSHSNRRVKALCYIHQGQHTARFPKEHNLPLPVHILLAFQPQPNLAAYKKCPQSHTLDTCLA